MTIQKKLRNDGKMNERIAQLAEEATYEMEFGGDDVLQTSNGEVSYEIPAGFIEAFAKMIIRECATLAFDGPGGILEHFGVEE